MPVLGVKDQFEFLQMKGVVRMSYLKTSASSVTYGRSCLRTPTPCARASLRHSNANCSPAHTSKPTNMHGKRCSRGSKVGTTSAVVIAASVTARRSATSNFTTNKTESAPMASCPPPAGVVVVMGDPPTGRGQLGARPKPEEISPAEIQLLNRPRKRVTPTWRRKRHPVCAWPNPESTAATQATSSLRRQDRHVGNLKLFRGLDLRPGETYSGRCLSCRTLELRSGWPSLPLDKS